MNEYQSRLDEIRSAIRVRLQHVCQEWPPELFDLMVERLATITLKYESQGSASPYDRRGTDRLVADLRKVLEDRQADPAKASGPAGDDT
jgi:hypothetical protein